MHGRAGTAGSRPSHVPSKGLTCAASCLQVAGHDARHEHAVPLSPGSPLPGKTKPRQLLSMTWHASNAPSYCQIASNSTPDLCHGLEQEGALLVSLEG